ncbi:McrC family protein [Arthrobacter sp. YN]|uniref:McrC family protein n=1 Tax=Arthrobacter sp. YN TaxID=2020486 RepID=UPI000B61358C|nr:hypothetical protein [Arthrobacter sp. YN]ASN19315.1 hypothetical protein CGK93_06135 [Arthrobacter sp. YN]
MLTLTEWDQSGPLSVTTAQRRVLEDSFSASFKSCGTGDHVQVTPGSVVGTVSVGGISIVVRPKIPIDRVLFMTAFTADPYHWDDAWSSISSVDNLVDGVIGLFVRACRTVTARGLLRSYRSTVSDLRYVKGRVRWPTQATRQQPIPIAVTYQVHDDDIVENQIIRETLKLLRATTSSNPSLALELHSVWLQFRDFAPLPDALATLTKLPWTRRNEHYRPVLELARIILENKLPNIDTGGVPVMGFTLKLPRVFESFVRACLRHYSGLSEHEFPDSWSKSLKLDEGNTVSLNPDLGIRVNAAWKFVGDVKYKRDDGPGKNADLYQLLAYATATQLSSATLIYAHGPSSVRTHVVRHTDVSIKVRHIELQKPPKDVLGQLQTIALEDLQGVSAPKRATRDGSRNLDRPRIQ